jgi:hypothetical protein
MHRINDQFPWITGECFQTLFDRDCSKFSMYFGETQLEQLVDVLIGVHVREPVAGSPQPNVHRLANAPDAFARENSLPLIEQDVVL